MPISHAQRPSQRLVEEIAAGHGDEELENSVAAQHGLGTEPAARHLENDLSATDEDDTAVGDDHACSERQTAPRGRPTGGTSCGDPCCCSSRFGMPASLDARAAAPGSSPREALSGVSATRDTGGG